MFIAGKTLFLSAFEIALVVSSKIKCIALGEHLNANDRLRWDSPVARYLGILKMFQTPFV